MTPIEWIILGGSVLSLLLSVGGNIYQNHTNTQFNQANNDLQRQLAGQANQWNIDQWNRENAYNDPTSQLARLAGAGLNPAMMYNHGGLMNEAAASPTATMANTHAAQIQNPMEQINQLDPLTLSQMELNHAQADKLRSETRYQDYMNAVEDQLSKIPIGEVSVTSENGETSTEVTYGNARVLITEREMRALGLKNQGLQYQLSDLFFDLAVKTGSYDFTSVASFDPLSSSSAQQEIAALRGDRHVRDLAGQLADIGFAAAQSQQSGQEAYGKWLAEHKDDPVVKFALTLQGLFQTLGINFMDFIPSGKTTKMFNKAGQVTSSSSSWYFGN